MPKGICLFSKRILIEGFSFFRGVGIPAPVDESTLLTIAGLYRRRAALSIARLDAEGLGLVTGSPRWPCRRQ